MQVAYFQSDPFSWDYEKVIDVDGKLALVGGMNYWTGDYIESSHPINDISMEVQRPAAGTRGGGRFQQLPLALGLQQGGPEDRLSFPSV